MNSRKPILINVPEIERSSANTSAYLTNIANNAESAAKIIRAKVDADARKQRELVENITDNAMRRSLKE